MNGGSVFLPNEQLCSEITFDLSIRKKLIALTHEFPETAFTFFTGTQVHLVNPNPFGQHISTIHYLAAQPTLAESLPEQIIKVLVLDEAPATLNRIKETTRPWLTEGAFSPPYTYEINPAGVTKALALEILLQKMGLIKLPIYVAGDAVNDLPLFEIAHQSFAPTSAHPIVLARADRVIPRNREGLLTPILTAIQKV